MLSEKRVAHMTKMAMLEDQYGRKLSPTLRYRKRDYLDMCTLGGVFLGTLIYIALYAGGILLVISTVVVNLHLVSTILFILYMYYYLRMVRRHAAKRYKESEMLARRLRKDYHVLHEMYQEEDLSKIPEGWD